MRQGDCAPCRRWIPTPLYQGATAHARYYGPFRLFKPMPSCSELITSAVLLDYIAGLDLHYVIIATSPC